MGGGGGGQAFSSYQHLLTTAGYSFHFASSTRKHGTGYRFCFQLSIMLQHHVESSRYTRTTANLSIRSSCTAP
eukprot:scaffold82834_cov59-Attheya_sp.AAC.5